jgi:hypothetical protein
MFLAERLAPRGVERRHGGVAGDVGMDLGQLDAARERQEQSVDLGPADHRNLAVTRQRQRLIHRMDGFGPFRLPVRIARQHDMPPARQRARKALEGLAAHDHRLAHGQRLEALEVGRDVPGQPALAPDRAVGGAGVDEEYLGAHETFPSASSLRA